AEAQRTIAADPSGLAARLPRAFLTPGGLRLPEAGLAILDRAGFAAPEAVSAWRALWSYTFGFATFDVAPAGEEGLRRARTAIAALPDDRYPSVRAAAGELAGALTDEREFARGLDRLLDGLEPLLKRQRTPARGRAPAAGARRR
ncbi:MAG: TetR/AcrR family transcriptional regulator C-terminal domain-containing protein, partial [Actinomycetota bacterium]|nr:TetR/AcrR family transcriptional regulator C-terminal domain-containing protein [Actinomycetota bacterium]